MTDKPDPRPGLTKFNLDDDIAPPTPAMRVSAKIEAERMGFVPDKPPRVSPRPATPVATFTANFHIRVLPNDRERFDDFAWRNRITKGEAMTRILDLALAAQKDGGR